MKNLVLLAGLIGTIVSLSTLGVGVDNGNIAETITTVGIYTHAWFLSFALGLPLIVLTFEALAIRKKDSDYMKAAIKASRVWGISFAAGAVTGTLVEFGLVQIWPGSILAIGTFFFAPLFIELFAFMMEIVFLAVYLFTWDLFKYQWKHWLFGLGIAIGTIWSGFQILTVNAWMNVPWGTGSLVQKVLPWEPSLGPSVVNQPVMVQIFNLLPKTGSGIVGNLSVIQSLGTLLTDPFIAFFNPEAIPLFLHTVTAAIMMVGFLGSFAITLKYLKNKDKKQYYAKLIKVTFGIAAIASILQPVFGDLEGKLEYTYMYTKFLALEGIPAQGGTNPILGILLFGNPSYFFPGFDYLRTMTGSSISPGMAAYTIDFAQQNQYWLSPLYYTMVILGVILFIFAIVYFGVFSKKINWLVKLVFRRDTIDVLFYSSLILPFLAMIAAIVGWIVREAGRHPWSVLGLITYNEIVTPVNLTLDYIAFILFIEVAIFIGGTVAMIISFNWKVRERTISIEPEPTLPGVRQ